MVESITGPVGLRWRSQNVTNATADQAAIIRLLAAIPEAQGGRQQAWAVPPLTGPNGSCPPALADAIWDFQSFWKAQGVFHLIDGVVDPGQNTLRQMNSLAVTTPPAPPPPPPGPPAVFIVHDVRLFGWKPGGDVLEVNGDTPLQWIIDNTVKRGKAAGGNLTLKIMSHGLPGFVQCGQGALPHPTLGTVKDPEKGGLIIGPGAGGISIFDLGRLAQLAGHVRRIEFHCCLVARIGPCFEANGHVCYDGNAFCFRLAQTTGAEVVASIHLQYYWKGAGPSQGMDFREWNGRVFTWAPAGNISAVNDYPYKGMAGPPPPGSPAL